MYAYSPFTMIDSIPKCVGSDSTITVQSTAIQYIKPKKPYIQVSPYSTVYTPIDQWWLVRKKKFARGAQKIN